MKRAGPRSLILQLGCGRRLVPIASLQTGSPLRARCTSWPSKYHATLGSFTTCRSGLAHGSQLNPMRWMAGLIDAAAELDPVDALQAAFMADVASVIDTLEHVHWLRPRLSQHTRQSPESSRKLDSSKPRSPRRCRRRSGASRLLTEVGQLLQPQSLLQGPDIMQ